LPSSLSSIDQAVLPEGPEDLIEDCAGLNVDRYAASCRSDRSGSAAEDLLPAEHDI
jgi:hypothetical protein